MDTKSLLKSALLELESMQARLRRSEGAATEPIAVIGLSCRFPGGADNPELFWNLLDKGQSGVRDIPVDRFAIDDYYDPDPAASGKIYTRYGAFLDRIADFDPQFFGISSSEAACLDPQQRLLLEVSWEALERAHVPPDTLFGSNTGVFIGTSSFEYASRLGSSVPAESITAYFGTGGALSATAGRLSYFFGFSGPSMTFDTACSSSLVALHQAVASLRARETDLALAGGVNLLISPQVYLTFCRAGMLAPDGRCKTFDAAADGFVRGEGCGVLVLRRLSDALASGAPILALVRGSAVNQDGASGGFTVPSGPSQQAVIRRALASAGVKPAAIDYVEAHGTGTSLGDPIEVGALGAVFGKERSSDFPLLVGSVKTNIGHLEGAAGIAGVIKVILSLLHETIPPHLHCSTPNAHIPWSQLPVRVTSSAVPWRRHERDRLAGVSSFGFTGTNAHIVLEEAPLAPARTANLNDRPLHLLTVSAKTPKALTDLARLYAEQLESDPGIDAADFCFSTNQGKSHFPFRWGVVGASPATLAQRLRERATANRTASSVGRLALFCHAADSELADGGRALHASSPVFRAEWRRCEEALQRDIPFRSGREHALATCIALTALWKSFNLQPRAFLGDGLGRHVARIASGACSLEEGMKQALLDSGAETPASVPDGLSAIVVAGPLATLTSANATTSVIQGGCEWDSVLHALATLYEAGFPIDWEAYDRPYSRHWVELPSYPFQRQRHWVDLAPQTTSARSHPLLGRSQRLPSGSLQWDSNISGHRPPYLAEHKVFGESVVPAAAFLEMALSAGAESLHAVGVADVIFHQALFLDEVEGRRLRLSLDTQASDRASFEISSALLAEEPWTLHCSGTIVMDSPAATSPAPTVRIEGTAVPVSDFYRRNTERHLEYGSAFRGVEELWGGSDEAWGLIRLPETLAAGQFPYRVHPALLDACFQVLGAAVPDTGLAADSDGAFLPLALSRLTWHGDPGDSVLTHVRVRHRNATGISADFEIFNTDRVLVAEVHGLQFARVRLDSLHSMGHGLREDLCYRSEWKEKPISVSVTGILPPSADLVSHLDAAFNRLASSSGIEHFTRGLEQLNQLAAAYASSALRDAHVGLRGPASPPHHQRLVERLRDIAALNETEAEAQRGINLEALLAAHPECEAEVQLVARCGSRLTEVLDGSLSPLEALIPRGDFSLVSAVYGRSLGAQIMNQLIGEAVSKCLSSLPHGRKLRVLEVGGGTGATTRHLLGRLSASQAEYVFSDVSPALVAQAKDTFGGFDFFQSRLLDIEQDPIAQGFAVECSQGQGFDIIVAANVLHATADLRTSLRNVRSLLAPGGALILLEGTSPQNWVDITFGLTEGWWRFTDLDLRPRHPLLAEDRWLAVLQEIGFDDARATSRGPQAILLARASADRPKDAAKPWLILADRSGVGVELARLFEARGETCTVVTDPDSDRQALTGASSWGGAVHLRSLDIPSASAPDFDRQWPLGCGSALTLAQSAWSNPFPIWLITRRAFASQGLAQSPLWGFGKVLALEHPALGGVRVDVDHDDTSDAAAAILEEIVAGNGETEVLRHGASRLVSRLVRHRPAPESRASFSSDGTYLITGGLRGLGLKIAEWMVAAGARHLALLGRTASGDAGISALEGKGVSVMSIQADISQPADVAGALARIAQSPWPLRGIIHAAVSLDDAMIPQQSRDSFRGVSGAKVDGAWNLHQQTLGMDLDCFVLFSSLASLLGSVGQSNYAAASMFLDGLAGVRRSAGLPCLSINWGPWSSVGIAAERRVLGRMETMGVGSLDPETGCRALGALLKDGASQIGVAAINWPRLLDCLPPTVSRTFLSEIASNGKTVDRGRVRSTAEAGAVGFPLEIAGLPVAERKRRLHAAVRELLAQTLGFPADQIDMSQPLVDAGLDSLLALQLKSRMENEVGFRVDLVKLIGGTTGTLLVDMAAGDETLEGSGAAIPEIPSPYSVVESLAQLDELSEEGMDSLLSRLLSEESDRE